MDIDDSREIRITSGQIIGIIMLLLALLPRDIRADLVARLHSMTTQELADWYANTTAGSSERAGNSTADPTSEGEVPESLNLCLRLILMKISQKESCQNSLKLNIRCSIPFPW